MQVGPTPLYLQVIQWANMIVSLIYPVAIVVILALALVEFKKLVRYQKKSSSAPRVGRSKSKASQGEE